MKQINRLILKRFFMSMNILFLSVLFWYLIIFLDSQLSGKNYIVTILFYEYGLVSLIMAFTITYKIWGE